MIYLDNAASTKMSNEVLETMLPFLKDQYYNASSLYSKKLIKGHIESAREFCGQLINAVPEEIIFTSGATEAINFALKGFIEENYHKGNHIITCKTEHSAVLSTLNYLEEKGVEVTYLDVDQSGLIELEQVRAAIRTNTILICVMLVNNETGIIQNIKEISNLAIEHEIKVFCDGTQGVGKIPVDVKHLKVDFMCASAHKIYGPKGIGFLYKKQGAILIPLLHGGDQENGYRGGTYNSAAIIGLGKACEIACQKMDANLKYIQELRDYMLSKLSLLSNLLVVSHSSKSSPYICNVIVENLDSNFFIEKAGIALSSGSACNTSIMQGSHVLKAMGYSEKQCKGALRISFSLDNTMEEIDILVNLIKEECYKI